MLLADPNRAGEPTTQGSTGWIYLGICKQAVAANKRGTLVLQERIKQALKSTGNPYIIMISNCHVVAWRDVTKGVEIVLSYASRIMIHYKANWNWRIRGSRTNNICGFVVGSIIRDQNLTGQQSLIENRSKGVTYIAFRPIGGQDHAKRGSPRHQQIPGGLFFSTNWQDGRQSTPV
ncbi:hypothetical protein BM449_11365 [Synechococcus sp. SynAce01]|nr:hypothetical protein BM449_11365 [Synechococcus sp. SynAce01]